MHQHAAPDHEALLAAAASGRDDALADLQRAHADAAWGLATAVTGSTADARRAVADAFGTVITAERTGRSESLPVPTRLLRATRHAAVDRVRARGDEPAAVDAELQAASPVLATAFWALPERQRCATWLDAAGVDSEAVAAVIELPHEETEILTARAWEALATRHADVHRSVHGETPDPDACAPAALSALTVDLPTEASDEIRAAWVAAVSAGTGTGLSRRTERVLAGASAFAAAVGVIGAALVGVGVGDGDPARPASAAPIAPLVTDVAAPSPVDLTGGLALPRTATAGTGGSGITAGAVETAAAVPVAEAAPTSAPVAPSTVAATAPPTTPVPDVTAADEGGDDDLPLNLPDDPSEGAVIGIDAIPGVPIAVDISDDPGITIGPVSLGSAPQPDDERNILQSSGASADSVTEATEVVEPAAPTAAEPVEVVSEPAPAAGDVGL